MKKGRGFLTIGLFALAATLLSFSVVGSSRAALTYFSDTYGAEVSMQDIGVTLVENGDEVSNRDYSGSNDVWHENTGALLEKMLGTEETGKEELALGKTYPEELCVKNSGTIDEYVRVTLYKYWEKNGEKQTDLDPGLIDLHLVNEDVWYRDVTSDTAERTVLYYRNILPSGEQSEPFTDTLVIEDEPIEAAVTGEVVTETADGTIIRTEYDYNGMKFVIQADVDAVQTHNAEDAIKSAWGVDMSAKGMG